MNVDADQPIRLTRDGVVATIWLNRPSKRNAMNYEMWASLHELASQLGDRSVSASRGRCADPANISAPAPTSRS